MSNKHKYDQNIILHEPEMTLCAVVSLLLYSCASTTMIQSTPDGAHLYLNGEAVGKTPYSHTDTKIIGSTNTVRLEKEGYSNVKTTFSRNGEVNARAIIGGLFVLFPFLWTIKYKPVYTYEMTPFSTNTPRMVESQHQELVYHKSNTFA